MSALLTDQWNALLLTVKAAVPAASFNTWLQHTTLEALEDDTAVIGVASHFIKEQVQAKYAATIQETFQQIFGLRPRLEFRISSKPFRELRRRQHEAEASPPPPRAMVRHAEPRPGSLDPRSPLHPGLRFERFTEGLSNGLALSACRRVAAGKAEFNPLLIVSASGLGKTHLLHALCHEAQAADESRRVRYLSCDALIASFLKAVETKRRETFRQALVETDLLVVDDIQTLGRGSKTATQEELVQLLDELTARGRQVVLAADEDPRRIEGLAPRLAKRLVSGLVLAIEPFDPALRAALVERKAHAHGLALDTETAEELARHAHGCGREVEGLVARLAAAARLYGERIDAEAVRRLAGLLPRAKEDAPPPTVTAVRAATATAFGLPEEALCGRGRERNLATARRIGMLLARQIAGASYREIGRAFGNRDHSTVHAALKDGIGPYERNDRLRERIAVIRRRFPSCAQARLFGEEETRDGDES